MDDLFSGTKAVDQKLRFDEQGLHEWFSKNLSEFGSIEKIEQFRGGQSNPTYKITTANKKFVLRRKPPGKLLPSAHAVDREYKVITALNSTDVPVPRTFGLCEDENIIGTSFFVMEFLDGNIYWDLLLEDFNPKIRRAIYDSKNKVISALHQVNFESIGLGDYGKHGNYVARQVSTWTKQYLASQTDDIEAMNNLIEWLPKNIPDDDETSIVHGDYRLDNMIFNDNHEVIGVLDWELSTLGHPIADFNYHCLNWRTLPQLQDEKYCKESGIPSEKEYMDMYAIRTGKDLNKHWEFYIIFNIFKIAAILQGILGRVRDGTATSKHAEERGMQVYPLSEAAWNNVLKEYG